MITIDPPDAEQVASRLRLATDTVAAFDGVTRGLDPATRARLAVEVAEWLPQGPAGVVDLLDRELETLGARGELGMFLRGLQAAIRIGISTSTDAGPYLEALGSVAEAQQLTNWSLLAEVLAAEHALARGRVAEARKELERLAADPAVQGHEELAPYVEALRAQLGVAGADAAIALGHLEGRRFEQALAAARAVEGPSLEAILARGRILGELAPLPEALPAIGRLGSAARQAGDAGLELVAHLLAAERICEAGDPTKHSNTALELAAERGDLGSAARAHAAVARYWAGVAHNTSPVESADARAKALEHLAQAVDLAERSGALDPLIAARLAEYEVSGATPSGLQALREAERLSRDEGSAILRAAVLAGCRAASGVGSSPQDEALRPPATTETEP